MELIKEIKQSKILRNVLISLIGTILLAISSKIKIPFYPVPMTMQTFVVLFLGIALGWKMGLATVALYLFEGIIGLPVFSGSPEKGVGLIYFTGPTMGYLIGFLFTVFFVGSFNFNKNFLIKFLQLSFSLPIHYETVYIIRKAVITDSINYFLDRFFDFRLILGSTWTRFGVQIRLNVVSFSTQK